MNILLTSVGRRVRIVEYFKRELSSLGGAVIAVDCDLTAPALYFADEYEIVPKINDPDYLHILKLICQKHEINAIISLIDPELSILARNKEEFLNNNIKIVVPESRIVDMCFDKYSTYLFLKENNLPCVPTYIDLDNIVAAIDRNRLQFPLLAKPRKGSASSGIKKVGDMSQLRLLFNNHDSLIAQPFIEGEEYGIDTYSDMISGKTINVFIKKKIKMRAGETDKSVAIRDKGLKEVIHDLLEELKPIGPMDIDVFVTKNGEYMISEINPRFGGGYPHAHEVGQNFVKYIINNLNGYENKVVIDQYEEGSTMIKYDDILMIER